MVSGKDSKNVLNKRKAAYLSDVTQFERLQTPCAC